MLETPISPFGFKMPAEVDMVNPATSALKFEPYILSFEWQIVSTELNQGAIETLLDFIK
jgi:hypothetical protein